MCMMLFEDMLIVSVDDVVVIIQLRMIGKKGFGNKS